MRLARRILATLALLAAPAALRAQEPPADATKLDTNLAIFQDVQFEGPVRGENDAFGEFAAYNETVLFARTHPQALLESRARTNLTFRDLVVPAGRDFQFDLVSFEGRLLKLRDVKPNEKLKIAGVEHLYEGFLFPLRGGLYGRDPICFVCTELPPGLPESPADGYVPAKLARVTGYFFKTIHYEARDPDPARRVLRTPLLIGRSLTVDPPTLVGTDDSDWWTGFLPAMLTMMTLIGATVLALAWFFRAGDRRHRAAMAARRARAEMPE